ncbi:MAG TPA: hydrogenase expression/formation protein HypE [Spirochaetota bacterium]|nr:hydrogenase expression/formation protein HypE [Spirochaetota bacterium]HPI89899.1 hydrogenase expression/formation protein HypE [Spirochaetota bacterium]HPR47832.1 hydrogenase expression/formation protein HypE [Spirochaetota bacterium]
MTVKKILQGHGSGGKLMNEMIAETIVKTLGSASVQLDDSAVLSIGQSRIAFTTDTFTITPVFFPGGNIGRLAVNGTVNDLAVMGADPLYLSCALILEEGLDFDEFESILKSMRDEADRAGVSIVTGDTKVVPNGKADKIFINTCGIGIISDEAMRREIEPGDRIIINGTIGDHGMAVMAQRNSLSFSETLESDCMHLNHLIKSIRNSFAHTIKFMRDPTRGGVASVLNEIVLGKNFSAMLYEDALPLRDPVKGACEILGLDPLYVANEGKVIIIADKEKAEDIVQLMRRRPEGKDAAIIGEITKEFAGKALVETSIGGKRILPLLIDEQLPRIC